MTEISDWAIKQKKLYADYFDELWKIKDAIGTYHSVKEIIAKQIQLAQEYSKDAVMIFIPSITVVRIKFIT